MLSESQRLRRYEVVSVEYLSSAPVAVGDSGTLQVLRVSLEQVGLLGENEGRS